MKWKSKLKPKKIYIIPTKLGGVFLALTLAIILLGFGYSNNLINLLGFFLLSLIFVAMILTHLQMKDLEFETLEIAPAYADGEVSLFPVFRNASIADRFGIQINFPELSKSAASLKTLKSLNLVSVRSKALTRAKLTFPVDKRGRYRITKLHVSSIFPLGLFYSWRNYACDVEYFVYPEAKGIYPLPDSQFPGGAEVGNAKKNAVGSSDFESHRSYRLGDSERHVDWKAYARHGTKLVKSFQDEEQQRLSLDWSFLEFLPIEARLSQLTLWIQKVQTLGIEFQLRIPDTSIAFGKGNFHSKKCLEALAVYPEGRPR